MAVTRFPMCQHHPKAAKLNSTAADGSQRIAFRAPTNSATVLDSSRNSFSDTAISSSSSRGGREVGFLLHRADSCATLATALPNATIQDMISPLAGGLSCAWILLHRDQAINSPIVQIRSVIPCSIARVTRSVSVPRHPVENLSTPSPKIQSNDP